MALDRYDETIDDDDVDNRIQELEDEQVYEVVRLRDDFVLESFDDETEAEEYIDKEDYNPERVIVRQVELDEDDAEELERLRNLREAVGVSSYTLYNESYFTADWARDEAISQGIRRGLLDEWPLSQIDWEEAASQRRDDLYEYSYTFDDTTFYSAE